MQHVERGEKLHCTTRSLNSRVQNQDQLAVEIIQTGECL
jgi:hypothetical protein